MKTKSKRMMGLALVLAVMMAVALVPQLALAADAAPTAREEVQPQVTIPEKQPEATEPPKTEEPAQTEEPADEPVDDPEVQEPVEEDPVEEEPTEEPTDEPIDEPADEPQEDVPTTGDAAATVLPALAVLAIAAAAAYMGLRKRA